MVLTAFKKTSSPKLRKASFSLEDLVKALEQTKNSLASIIEVGNNARKIDLTDKTPDTYSFSLKKGHLILSLGGEQIRIASIIHKHGLTLTISKSEIYAFQEHALPSNTPQAIPATKPCATESFNTTSKDTPPSTKDQELYHRIVNDLDEIALSEYYQSKWDRLVHFAQNRIYGSEEKKHLAEDMVQETFLIIWEKFEKEKSLRASAVTKPRDNQKPDESDEKSLSSGFCKTPAYFDTWAHKILIRSIYRHFNRPSSALDKEILSFEQFAFNDGLKAEENVSKLADREDKMGLEDPLRELERKREEAKQQEIINFINRFNPNPVMEKLLEPLRCSALDLMSFEEIGKQLNIPENTAKTRAFRARKHLREMFSP